MCDIGDVNINVCLNPSIENVDEINDHFDNCLNLSSIGEIITIGEVHKNVNNCLDLDSTDENINVSVAHDTVNTTERIPLNDYTKAKELRLNYPSNVILSFININSIRHKIDQLMEFAKGNIDILAIAETKLNKSFPEQQFFSEGYKLPYRHDQTHKSGGLLVYINKDIPSRRLTKFEIPSDIQIIPFELNLRKKKWLIIACYKLPSMENKYFFTHLNNIISYYLKVYDTYLLIGDFNLETNNNILKDFMIGNNLTSLIKQATCFKSLTNPSCIDLILTNKPTCFQKSQTFETGLSDYHCLIYTIFKITYKTIPPKRFIYRDYKKFSEDDFLRHLLYNLRGGCRVSQRLRMTDI